jgi:hypothetical protein
MRNLAKKLLLIWFLILGQQANAALIDDICPFAGIDYLQRWTRGSGDWAKIFPRSYSGFSAYVGGRWDCFAIELGYDWSQRRKHDFSLRAGDTFFNTAILEPGISGNARVELQGGHIDLHGYLPVVDCIELIGVVGIGYVQPRVTISVDRTFSDAVRSTFITATGQGHIVGRLRFGGSYMISPCIGLRALFGWEGFESLRVKTNSSVTGFSNKGFKFAFTAAGGIFVKF